MTEVPDPLVSDADREQAVERLRVACAEGRLDLDEFSDRVGDVYRARTTADLVALTGDVPALPEPVPDPDAGARRTRWVVGLFSGARQTGAWRPGRPTRAVAVFGSCQLDLTLADLEPETRIVAVAVAGGIEVLVPEGVGVDLGGFAVLGGRDDRTFAHRRPGGPIVRVECRAVLGGVTVRTRPFSGR